MGGASGTGVGPPVGLTIIEQPAAQEARDEAEAKWSKAHLVWESITWVMMHDLHAGVPLTESGRTKAVSFAGARSIDMPDVTVIYELQEPYLIVHSARFTEAKHRHAGSA